jgi:hypothetical protein
MKLEIAFRANLSEPLATLETVKSSIEFDHPMPDGPLLV